MKNSKPKPKPESVKNIIESLRDTMNQSFSLDVDVQREIEKSNDSILEVLTFDPVKLRKNKKSLTVIRNAGERSLLANVYSKNGKKDQYKIHADSFFNQVGSDPFDYELINEAPEVSLEELQNLKEELLKCNFKVSLLRGI